MQYRRFDTDVGLTIEKQWIQLLHMKYKNSSPEENDTARVLSSTE
jgi:hypothetical protein